MQQMWNISTLSFNVLVKAIVKRKFKKNKVKKGGISLIKIFRYQTLYRITRRRPSDLEKYLGIKNLPKYQKTKIISEIKKLSKRYNVDIKKRIKRLNSKKGPRGWRARPAWQVARATSPAGRAWKATRAKTRQRRRR